MSQTVDFVAIDVETANANMASICQVGLASFSGPRLVDEWKSLVDPEDVFDYPNICIHGIRPEDVVGEPTLPEIVHELRARLDGQVVVCHTHFDRVSLHQACRRYDLDEPGCRWLDSARVARRTWTQFASSGYGLLNVCDHIGYSYVPHDALEDAKAAGALLLAAVAESGLSVEQWIERVGQPINSAAGSYHSHKREGNSDGPLVGEVVIFTGELTIPRREAADLAASLGCMVLDSVTKKTTILVVGDQDVTKLAGHEKSSKHRKAEALVEQGLAIRILRESDFVELAALASGTSPEQASLTDLTPSCGGESGTPHNRASARRSRSDSGALSVTIGFAGDGWDDDDWDDDEEVYYGEGVEQDIGEALDLEESRGFPVAVARLKDAEANYADPVSLHAIYETLIGICLGQVHDSPECADDLAVYVDRDLALLASQASTIADEERRQRIEYAETRPEPYRSELLAELDDEGLALNVWALTGAALHYARVGDYASALHLSHRAAEIGLDDGTKGGFSGRAMRMEKKLLGQA